MAAIKIHMIMREPLSGRSWTSKVFNTVITLDTYQFFIRKFFYFYFILCDISMSENSFILLGNSFILLFWWSYQFSHFFYSIRKFFCSLGNYFILSGNYFQNPFDKDKTVGLCIWNTLHKKGLKFALVVELAKLNFTYITVLK